MAPKTTRAIPPLDLQRERCCPIVMGDLLVVTISWRAGTGVPPRGRRRSGNAWPLFRLGDLFLGSLVGRLLRRLFRNLRMVMAVLRHALHRLHIVWVRLAAVRVMILTRACFGLVQV